MVASLGSGGSSYTPVIIDNGSAFQTPWPGGDITLDVAWIGTGGTTVAFYLYVDSVLLGQIGGPSLSAASGSFFVIISPADFTNSSVFDITYSLDGGPELPFTSLGVPTMWTPLEITTVQLFRDVGGGALVYTTTGGSTLSTDGTAAARIVDSKNTSYNALASVSPATYKIGANGKPYLLFNGSGDRYDNLSVNPVFTAHCFSISGSGWFTLFDTPANFITGRMVWINPSSRPEVDNALVTGSVLNNNVFVTLMTARGPSTTEMWINNVSVGTSATIRAAVTAISEFNRGGASTFNGCVSSWLFGSARPSASERALLHSYMMANTPT
jgi:hypothetical protein